MKKWAVYFLCSLTFLCGAVATYFVMHYLQANGHGQAYLSKSFSSKGEETPVYSEGALAQKDLILFPKINNLKFRAKFLEPAAVAENSLSLSYIAELSVEKLDKKDLPEKFFKKFEEANAAWMYVPPDDVLYEISFKLALLDKDGFQIFSTESPTETIRSGELNRVQNIVTDKIPVDIAKRTSAVKPVVVLKKCVRPLYHEKSPVTS
ncbi:MAG: hypothetical protein NT006_12315 [Candidatus Aminicenantes bacterium]|nr:hypothetical protein [Candidatus Aminicenantes bacterium]